MILGSEDKKISIGIRHNSGYNTYCFIEICNQTPITSFQNNLLVWNTGHKSKVLCPVFQAKNVNTANRKPNVEQAPIIMKIERKQLLNDPTISWNGCDDLEKVVLWFDYFFLVVFFSFIDDFIYFKSFQAGFMIW